METYPNKRPQPFAPERTVAACFSVLLISSAVWLPAALLVLSLISGNWGDMIFSLFLAIGVVVGGMIAEEAAGGESFYAPRLLRFFGARRPDSYEPQERQMLEPFWTLNEAIGQLNDLNQQLNSRLKDLQDPSQLEKHARQALSAGEDALAQSLVASSLSVKAQRAWLDEQIGITNRQLALLKARRDNLKTRLTLYRQSQDGDALSSHASSARRQAAEAVVQIGGGEHAPAFDDEARIAAIAELREAGFFDDSEATSLAFSDDLAAIITPAAVEETLARLRRQAATLS